MAALLLRGMKGVNISCASPASTAIYTGMDEYQRPQMRERFRMKALNSLMQSSRKTKSDHQKSEKSTEKPSDLISPAGSSRYLLSEDEADFLEVYPDWDPIPSLVTMESARFQSVMEDDSPVLKPSSSSASSSLSRFHTEKSDEADVLKTSTTGALQGRVYLRSDSSSSSPRMTRFHVKEGDESASLKSYSDIRAVPSTRLQTVEGDESAVLKPSSSSQRSREQVYFRAASPSTPCTRFQTVEGDESTLNRSRDPVYTSAAASSSSSPCTMYQNLKGDPVYIRAAASSSSSSPCTRYQNLKGGESAVFEPQYSDRSRDQVYSRTSTSRSSPGTRFQTKKADDSAVLKPSDSARSGDQVVVLRVSLHCKGCEGKVRKHISRMEGVTSFNIDFATKKVTVIGDVTPLGVLSSISKVKNAQFWPSPKHNSSQTKL